MDKQSFFFIVGAQRCGTTFLANLMDQHPSICFASPIRPEPKYFLNKKININEYINQYFSGVSKDKVCGEKSTSYIESEKAARNIKKHFDKAKIIISLRNPVERALSNYFFSKLNKIETRSLQDVFINNTPPLQRNYSTSVNPFDYLKRGNYSNYITTYTDIFGSENIHFVNFENLNKSPQKTVNDVFNFLNLPSFEVNTKTHKNEAKRDKVDPNIIEFLEDYYKDESKYLEILFN